MAAAGVASAVAATARPTRRRRSSVWAPWSSSWSGAAGGPRSAPTEPDGHLQRVGPGRRGAGGGRGRRVGGGRRGRLLAARARRVRGGVPGVLPGGIALRRLGPLGGGRPLRSAAALAHGVRRRQHGAARPRLAFTARHRRELWPPVRRRRGALRRREAGTTATTRGLRRSPGRRPVSGRRHALVPGLAPPDVGRREHGRLQAVDRRLLSRGPPSNLRRRTRGVQHRGLPDGRRARAPLPLWGVHDASLHQAGLGHPFVRGLRRHPGAHGRLLHRPRGVRPRRRRSGAAGPGSPPRRRCCCCRTARRRGCRTRSCRITG